MAKIRVSKVDAARRQLDLAIRLQFQNADPWAIHTLASAAYRILRDLCDLKKTPYSVQMKNVIRSGLEKKFWSAVNKGANFLKHADEDPNEILEVEEEFNDHILIGGFMCYVDLGHEATAEMRAWFALYGAMYPDVLNDDADPSLRKLLESAHWLRSMSRSQKMKLGAELLAAAKAT